MIKAIVFLLFTFNLYSQTYIFVETFFNNKGKIGGDNYKHSAFWAQRNISKNTGVFAWGQKFNGGDSQVYAGPFFQVKNLQFGSGFGFQNWNKGSNRRFAHFAFYEKGNFSNFFVLEHKGGVFVLNQTNYKVSKRFGIGSLFNSPFGFGPRVEFRPEKHFAIYLAPVYKQKTGQSVILGIRFFPN